MASDTLTGDVGGQALNTARVQAGSQYAAIESAVNYTTDLTINRRFTVNGELLYGDSALSEEPNLQQAATAMRSGKLRSTGTAVTIS